MIGMQAPVTDRAAILLAQEVFQALAGGDALDASLARARATILDALQTDSDGMRALDWACPVAWTSGLSQARLSWRSPASRLAHMQTASRRACFDRSARALFPPTDEEREQVSRISLSNRCWVAVEYSAEHRERWIRMLLALQTLLPRYIVAVELGEVATGSLEDRLRLWAEELSRTLEPSDASAEFLSALEQMRTSPSSGWAKLCRLEDTLVSIWNPPHYSPSEWFWASLVNTAGPVVVAAGPIDASLMNDGWTVEDIRMPHDLAALESAFVAAPVLTRALALLEMPVPQASIAAVEGADRVPPPLDPFVVHTTAGEIVLVSSVAKSVRDRMGEAELQTGHRVCMGILDHASFAGRLTPLVREHRLRHCLGAHEWDAATAEAAELLRRYRAQDRPRAAVNVVEHLGPRWRTLAPRLFLVVAWAHVMLGDMEQASLWLSFSDGYDAFEAAWRAGLEAEIAKARGDRDDALAHVDRAIAALENANLQGGGTTAARRRQRSYRQDRARILQYLYYDAAAARKEYEVLLAEWADSDDAAFDVATVLRNYSECVRGDANPGTPSWAEAKAVLDRASTLLVNNEDRPIFAEIQYEKARIALREGAQDARSQLDTARGAAMASGHLMLLAIVQARIFWEFEAFSLERWLDLDAGLAAFPRHGWAVRTLIDGRLRAAKGLSDIPAALELVAKSQRALDDNPGFTQGSDRFRIAACAAGEELLGAGEHWRRLLILPWATSWLEQMNCRTPADVWAKVR